MYVKKSVLLSVRRLFLLVIMSANLCLRFIKYYLLLLVVTQVASSLFRVIGAIGRDMIMAFLYGYFILLLVFALSGFVLFRGTESLSLPSVTILKALLDFRL